MHPTHSPTAPAADLQKNVIKELVISIAEHGLPKGATLTQAPPDLGSNSARITLDGMRLDLRINDLGDEAYECTAAAVRLGLPTVYVCGWAAPYTNVPDFVAAVERVVRPIMPPEQQLQWLQQVCSMPCMVPSVLRKASDAPGEYSCGELFLTVSDTDKLPGVRIAWTNSSMEVSLVTDIHQDAEGAVIWNTLDTFELTGSDYQTGKAVIGPIVRHWEAMNTSAGPDAPRRHEPDRRTFDECLAVFRNYSSELTNKNRHYYDRRTT